MYLLEYLFIIGLLPCHSRNMKECGTTNDCIFLHMYICIVDILTGSTTHTQHTNTLLSFWNVSLCLFSVTLLSCDGHVHNLLLYSQSPSLPPISSRSSQICRWHVSLHLSYTCIAYGHCVMGLGPWLSGRGHRNKLLM